MARRGSFVDPRSKANYFVLSTGMADNDDNFFFTQAFTGARLLSLLRRFPEGCGAGVGVFFVWNLIPNNTRSRIQIFLSDTNTMSNWITFYVTLLS